MIWSRSTILVGLVVSVLPWLVQAQSNDFSELELGDDNFGLKNEDLTSRQQAFGVENLPNIPEAGDKAPSLGDDPAAKVPRQFNMDLSKDGLEQNQLSKSPVNTVPAQLDLPAAAVVPVPPVDSTNAAQDPSPAFIEQSPPASLPEPAPATAANNFQNGARQGEGTDLETAPATNAFRRPEVETNVKGDLDGKSNMIGEAGTVGGSNTMGEPIQATTVEEGLEVDPQEPDQVIASDGFEDDYGPEAPQVSPINDFSGVPYVPGSRRIMAAGEAPERYKVEEGDTLYDICDQLLDEPDYWPKLWALNPGIKNPHFIFPGMVLSFYPGDEETPPYLEVVSEDDIVPIETGGVDEKDLVSSDVGELVIEDREIPDVEVVDISRGQDFENIDVDMDFEYAGEAYKTDQVTIDVPAFILEQETDVLGEIVSGDFGQINAKRGERVVIEKFSELPVGGRYTVVRPSGFITNQDGEDVGFRYEYVAQVQILSGTDDGDFVISAVSRSRLGVQPKDQVIAYKSTIRTFSTGNLVFNDSPTTASIVGFEYPNREIGGQGNLLFVDEQFSAGTVLPVFQRIDKRIGRILGAELPAVTSRIGVLKVIDVVGSTSLAILLKSSLDVRLGDRLGSG